MFTNNSTAESCFFWRGSSSKLLHKLVLRLRKAKLEHKFALHVVHVAETRMIAQGTNGLSRGIFLEGVMGEEDMLSFVDLVLAAIEKHPGVLDFVKSWVNPILVETKVLDTEEWYQEGHRIVGGKKDTRGLWIPYHTPNGKAYIWSPPPIIADVALEEWLKAIHKQTNGFHIFLIP